MKKNDDNIILKLLYENSDQNKRILSILENDDKTGRMGLVQFVSVIRIDVDALVHAHREFKAKVEKEKEIELAVKRKQTMIYGSIGASALLILKWIGGELFPIISKIISKLI